jgi:head-tail adaptor
MRGGVRGPSRSGPRPVSAGDLTEKVRIEVETVLDDGYGGRTRAWALYAEAWAKITPVAAREIVVEGAERASASWRITLYRNAGITAGMRVVWGTLALNIREAPIPSPHELLMVMMAESGVRIPDGPTYVAPGDDDPDPEPGDGGPVGIWGLIFPPMQEAA